MSKPKIYFIDSENVGDHWISLLSQVTSEDEILVFYTAKSPHMSYKNLILLKESPKEVQFIECCEGNNALDFQLSTELGFRIHDALNDEYIIVSNDTGFDAVVRYWKKRGFPVKRIKGDMCAVASQNPDTSSTSAVEPPLNDTVEITSDHLAEPKETSSNGVDDAAKEILYIVGKDNLQNLHAALQAFYGTKKANPIYNAFKSESAYNNFLTKHPKLTKAEKQNAYCSLVFTIQNGSLQMPKDFSSFLVNTWKNKNNLNSLRSALQNKYGKELSEKYYSLIKPHVKIISTIK